MNPMEKIDLRKVLRVALEHWWWLVLSVVLFMALGTAYYLRKAPSWTTDAAIMLRQKDAASGMEAFSMLGLTGNQAAEDEVVVLASRGLLYQAIDALDLWEANSKRGGLRWEGEFRNPAMTIEYIDLSIVRRSRWQTSTARSRPVWVRLRFMRTVR